MREAFDDFDQSYRFSIRLLQATADPEAEAGLKGLIRDIPKEFLTHMPRNTKGISNTQ